MTRPRCGLVVLALAIGSVALADDPKPAGDTKAFDKAVVDSLREVHHVGRELYNTSKDFTGTYRVYQGALLAVKPLLAHRPEVQKAIESGLAAADKEPEVARKAFMLHETIEKTRSTLRTEAKITEMKKVEETKKPAEAKKEEMKKPAEAKPMEPPTVAPMPKKKPDDVAKKPAGGPGFGGVVTLQGKPLVGGDLQFVSLDQKLPRIFSATTQADGKYALEKTITPGTYAVTVSGKGVPEKYHTTTTSGLRAEVKELPTTFDIVLR